MAQAFDSHLLTMEEVWWVRAHPWNIVSVKVRKAVADVEQAERDLDDRRKALDTAAKELNQRMGGNHAG